MNTSEPNPINILHKSGHPVDYIIAIEIYDDKDRPVNYVFDE